MINKTLLTIIILFCGAIITTAQNDFAPEWDFGIGFGPTFSTVSFDHRVRTTRQIETTSLGQFHGGISARYISEKNLGLMAELNFSQQGWEENFKDNPEFSYKRSLTYIEIPVLSHIYFGRKVRFFINLGSKIQFLLGESEKMNEALADYLANSEEETAQYNQPAKYKFDYGLMGGMGLELRTKIGRFALEGRYYAGFGDLFDNSARGNNFSRSANRVISAKLTYYTKLF